MREPAVVVMEASLSLPSSTLPGAADEEVSCCCSGDAERDRSVLNRRTVLKPHGGGGDDEGEKGGEEGGGWSGEGCGGDESCGGCGCGCEGSGGRDSTGSTVKRLLGIEAGRVNWGMCGRGGTLTFRTEPPGVVCLVAVEAWVAFRCLAKASHSVSPIAKVGWPWPSAMIASIALVADGPCVGQFKRACQQFSTSSPDSS